MQSPRDLGRSFARRIREIATFAAQAGLRFQCASEADSEEFDGGGAITERHRRRVGVIRPTNGVVKWQVPHRIRSRIASVGACWFSSL